jgi:hypothetical protein
MGQWMLMRRKRRRFRWSPAEGRTHCAIGFGMREENFDPNFPKELGRGPPHRAAILGLFFRQTSCLFFL